MAGLRRVRHHDDVGQTTAATGFGPGASPYRALCTLARGGMGQVDLCVRRTGTFERLYAVKRLHPHLREDEAMRSMFLDEARVAGLVRHANVVAVLDVGEDVDGPYLVMDYVEGVSLSRFVRARAKVGTHLPVPLCAQIIAQVARGLHAAHELAGSDGAPLDLVHRDVSPQNILVGRDGTVRVTDFGIAKALGRSTHTSTGVLKGKVGYMSPEQLRFERVDRRSDLFALGVVLFELVHLRRLYSGGDGAEVARCILHEVPPDLGEGRADVPPALVELSFQLLAKDREDRPATAQEVAERLEELVSAYGEVVDLGGHIEQGFGPELETEHERIRALVEREATDSALVASTPHDPPAAFTSRPRRLGWIAGAFLVAALSVGGVLVATADRERSTAPLLVAEPPPGGVTPQATAITLEVESRPTDARISLNEVVIGRTPLSFQVARGGDPVVVTVTRDGFVPAEHAVVPDRDQSVLVALTPAPAASAPAAAADDAPPAVPSRPSRARKRRPSAAAPAPDPAPRSQFRKFE